MLKKYRKIIIFVLVVVLGFVLYTIFLKPQAEKALLESSGPQEVDVAGQEIIETLGNIESIKLNNSVFNDPLYLRLRDDSQEIQPEDLRRENPFAPIEGQGVLDIDIDLETESEDEEGENGDQDTQDSDQDSEQDSETEPESDTDTGDQINNQQ